MPLRDALAPRRVRSARRRCCFEAARISCDAGEVGSGAETVMRDERIRPVRGGDRPCPLDDTLGRVCSQSGDSTPGSRPSARASLSVPIGKPKCASGVGIACAERGRGPRRLSSERPSASGARKKRDARTRTPRGGIEARESTDVVEDRARAPRQRGRRGIPAGRETGERNRRLRHRARGAGSTADPERSFYSLMTSETVRNPSVPLLEISVLAPVGVPPVRRAPEPRSGQDRCRRAGDTRC